MSGKLFQQDDIPTEPIKSELASIIQEKIIEELLVKYPCMQYVKLGSVGKKDGYNNDIDIGIKAENIDELSIMIHNVFDYTDTVDNKTIYIISIKYPYVDEGVTKYVAVDFILVDNIEYTKFRYYCPNYKINESKYKVGTKIMFLGTILNHCIDKKYKEISDVIPSYSFLPTGLYVELFEYTSGINAEILISQNPQEITNIMFDNAKPDICNSVESLWKGIHSKKFKYPEYVKSIELSFFINSYRKGWEELVKPEDFDIQYWSIKEIKEKLKVHTKLRNINLFLNKI